MASLLVCSTLPTTIWSTSLASTLERSSVDAKDVDQIVVGNVLQTSKDAIYFARHIGLKVGAPIETPALTVNRLCGSGLQAGATEPVDSQRGRLYGRADLEADVAREVDGVLARLQHVADDDLVHVFGVHAGAFQRGRQRRGPD